MVIGIHISISRYVCTKNYKKLIILTFTFHRFETPTNERRQGSIPKEAPWKRYSLSVLVYRMDKLIKHLGNPYKLL